MRPKILITNVDKQGRVSNKWYVRIGRQWRLFSHKDWDKGGIEWIKEQLTGKKPG
jgi:uncharacterized protein YodC (DUF2158 family)